MIAGHSEKHTFAFYLEGLCKRPFKATFEIDDMVLYKRTIRTLRLRTGDVVTLFDSEVALEIEIDERTFNAAGSKIYATVLDRRNNCTLKPLISLYLCITKKSTFEEMAYTATQMGVHRIIPVESEKAQRMWGGEREERRLHKIMIAASEQSKQFVLPQISTPERLTDVVSHQDSQKIFFDTEGQSLTQLFQTIINSKKPECLDVLFGPEGGLTEQEMELLSSNGFAYYALTVLRSQDAVVVGLGALRSIY